MKKITIKFLLLLLPLVAVTAQTNQTKKPEIKKIKTEKVKKTLKDSIDEQRKIKKYNVWSVNINGGVNIGVKPFTPGYFATTPNYFNNPDFNHFEFNVRKMFNTKFGLRWDFVYDNFKNQPSSLPFSNNMYRTSVQAVMNMHRVMNWEEFNDTFGLQLHLGPGFSFLNAPGFTTTFNHYDNIFSFVGGATALVKISNHFMFSFDYTVVGDITHHINLDGQGQTDPGNSRTGTIYTSSLGLTYYFGKKEKHADWYYDKEDKLAPIKNRIAAIESMLSDMDKDGVPDYLDTENNTAAGAPVNNKGQAIDLNNNGVPDEVEKYINNKCENLAPSNSTVVMGDNNVFQNAQMKSMINNGFVNVFFDFDQTRITTGTISAINWLIKYLNANPNSKLKIIGYADELGDFNYNIDLSHRRANVVREMIVRWGISPSRISLLFKGEDNSVPKESKLARQLVRRVTFEVE